MLGTRNRNRTCNYPLGGGYYIHLTMQACYLIVVLCDFHSDVQRTCKTVFGSLNTQKPHRACIVYHIFSKMSTKMKNKISTFRLFAPFLKMGFETLGKINNKAYPRVKLNLWEIARNSKNARFCLQCLQLHVASF